MAVERAVSIRRRIRVAPRTARATRVLELVAAATCAVSAFAKLLGPTPGDAECVAVAAQGAAEATLAAWLADGARPRAAAAATALVGLALAAAALLDWPSSLDGRPQRLVAALVLVLLGGLRLSVRPLLKRQARRRRPRDEIARFEGRGP
jgi:hypothetical protein